MIDPRDTAFASAYDAAIQFLRDRSYSDVRFYPDELAEELTKRGNTAEYLGKIILELVALNFVRHETFEDRVRLNAIWQPMPTTTAEPRGSSYENDNTTETANREIDATGAMIIVRCPGEVEETCDLSATSPNPGKPKAADKAFASYELAERIAGRTLTDNEAYQLLKDTEGENHDNVSRGLADYKLPVFSTWARYVRDGRKAAGANKNSSRANRKAGRSVVKADEL